MAKLRLTLLDSTTSVTKIVTENGVEEKIRQKYSKSNLKILKLENLDMQAARSSSAATAGKKIKGYPKKELMIMTRAVGAMLKSPTLKFEDALGYYAEGLSELPLQRACIDNILTRIRLGDSADRAFKSTGMFDDNFLGMITAGTKSGRMRQAFQSISKRIRSERVFTAKLRKAITIPIGVLSFLMLIFIVSQVTLVPMVENTLKEVGQTPDAFSGTVFAISHVVRIAWPFIVMGYFAFAAALFFLPAFRESLVTLLMAKWKLLRNLVMGLRQLTFLGTLNMLVSNGILLVDALTICAESLKKTPLGAELIKVRDEVKVGMKCGDALKRFSSCDQRVCNMLGMAEESSGFADQLNFLEELYEEDTNENMTTFTDTVSLISIVSAVGFMAIVFIMAYMPLVLMGPRMMAAAGH